MLGAVAGRVGNVDGLLRGWRRVWQHGCSWCYCSLLFRFRKSMNRIAILSFCDCLDFGLRNVWRRWLEMINDSTILTLRGWAMEKRKWTAQYCRFHKDEWQRRWAARYCQLQSVKINQHVTRGEGDEQQNTVSSSMVEIYWHITRYNRHFNNFGPKLMARH